MTAVSIEPGCTWEQVQGMELEAWVLRNNADGALLVNLTRMRHGSIAWTWAHAPRIGGRMGATVGSRLMAMADCEMLLAKAGWSLPLPIRKPD